MQLLLLNLMTADAFQIKWFIFRQSFCKGFVDILLYFLSVTAILPNAILPLMENVTVDLRYR